MLLFEVVTIATAGHCIDKNKRPLFITGLLGKDMTDIGYSVFLVFCELTVNFARGAKSLR